MTLRIRFSLFFYGLLILFLIPFIFNVYKDKQNLQNHSIQYPQWPLIILYAYRSSLDAAEKPFNIQHFQKQKYAICGETQHNGIKENSKICEGTYAKKTYKPKFTCKTKF